MLIQTRTPTTSIVASLCDATETSVVVPTIDISRGSDGNHTNVIDIPALNVDHTVYSNVVSTESLSDPGVTITIPASVSNFLNLAF